MAGWQVELGEVVVSSSDAAPAGHVALVAHRGGAEVWRLALDATGGDGALMPRMQAPQRLGDCLVVRTDGEHWRGASSHEPRVHVLDAGGTVIWWRPWRVEALAEVARGWVFVTLPDLYRVGGENPLAQALWVDPADGTAKRTWDLELKGSDAASAARTSWVSRRCRVVRQGREVYAEVDASWTGGSCTVRTRLKGAER